MRHLARSRRDRAAGPAGRPGRSGAARAARCVRREAGGRAGDRKRRGNLAAGLPDGRGDARQPELELVDRRGVAEPAHRLERRSSSARSVIVCGVKRSSSSRERRRTERHEHLPVRGHVVRHAAADPVRARRRSARCRAERDARRRASPGSPRLIVSPVSRASSSSAGAASSTRRCVPSRWAKRSSTGPGLSPPRSPARWTSPCRSSAPTRREVVLFGRPAPAASSPTASGRGLSTTRTSSEAARSIAWVPVSATPILWNMCSTSASRARAARAGRPARRLRSGRHPRPRRRRGSVAPPLVVGVDSRRRPPAGRSRSRAARARPRRRKSRGQSTARRGRCPSDGGRPARRRA